MTEAPSPLRIVVVTDAWIPQVNGVVRTLRTIGDEVKRLGHSIIFITPDLFRSIPCPTYPEIRLSMNAGAQLAEIMKANSPDAVHIATEGPLGIAARRWCLRHDFPFTTAFHTRFPDYIHARFKVPVNWSWAVLKWFHGPSKGVMVATQTLERELNGRGLGQTKIWTRGVDLDLFRPRKTDLFDQVDRPVFLFVGRIAIEKNIEAFLKLDLPGTKVVVGDGPALDSLRRRHPDCRFLGALAGEELASCAVPSTNEIESSVNSRNDVASKSPGVFTHTRNELSSRSVGGEFHRNIMNHLLGGWSATWCCTSWNKPIGTISFKRPLELPSGDKARAGAERPGARRGLLQGLLPAQVQGDRGVRGLQLPADDPAERQGIVYHEPPPDMDVVLAQRPQTFALRAVSLLALALRLGVEVGDHRLRGGGGRG